VFGCSEVLSICRVPGDNSLIVGKSGLLETRHKTFTSGVNSGYRIRAPLTVNGATSGGLSNPDRSSRTSIYALIKNPFSRVVQIQLGIPLIPELDLVEILNRRSPLVLG
jgi:hypothetical protein